MGDRIGLPVAAVLRRSRRGVRPMKFHHMTKLLAERLAAEQQCARTASRRRVTRRPTRAGGQERELGARDVDTVDGERADVDEEAVLEGGVEGQLRASERRQVELGAEQGSEDRGRRWTTPAMVPTNTCRAASATVACTASCLSKNGSPWRASSGSTIQSCTPCSRVVSPIDTSECEMPRPAVIRLSSPGWMRPSVPTLSRCSISPSKSQLAVCSPVCGCGGTTMLSDVAGSVVVGEAPGADGGAAALREGAVHLHGARPAERHLTRLEDLHAGCHGSDGCRGRLARMSSSGCFSRLLMGASYCALLTRDRTPSVGWPHDRSQEDLAVRCIRRHRGRSGARARSLQWRRRAVGQRGRELRGRSEGCRRPRRKRAGALRLWLAGGEQIALTLYGSSGCPPVGDTMRVASSNSLVVSVVPIPPDQACTADYAPHTTVFATPTT